MKNPISKAAKFLSKTAGNVAKSVGKLVPGKLALEADEFEILAGIQVFPGEYEIDLLTSKHYILSKNVRTLERGIVKCIPLREIYSTCSMGSHYRIVMAIDKILHSDNVSPPLARALVDVVDKMWSPEFEELSQSYVLDESGCGIWLVETIEELVKSGKLAYTDTIQSVYDRIKKTAEEFEEFFCPNCNATLNDQPGFSPSGSIWTCTECGQLLFDEETNNGENFSGTV